MQRENLAEWTGLDLCERQGKNKAQILKLVKMSRLSGNLKKKVPSVRCIYERTVVEKSRDEGNSVTKGEGKS